MTIELGKQLFETVPTDMQCFVPNRAYVENTLVGSWVLDCFGKMAQVVEIHARGNDINGKAYICFYTQFSENSRMSGSMKEDELIRTVPLSSKFTSHELDAIEEYLISREKTHSDFGPTPLKEAMDWFIKAMALSFAINVNDIREDVNVRYDVSNGDIPPYCYYCHTNHYGYQDHDMT